MTEACVDPEDINFDLVLIDAGVNRVETLKRVREFQPGLTLVQAKHLLDHLPAVAVRDVNFRDIRKVVRAFWGAGATVRLGGPFATRPDELERIMWPNGVLPSPRW